MDVALRGDVANVIMLQHRGRRESPVKSAKRKDILLLIAGGVMVMMMMMTHRLVIKVPTG